MAQLDRFFQVLMEREALELRMQTHGGMALRFADGERSIYSKPLEPATLSALLREVMGDDHFLELRSTKQSRFRYRSPHGTVQGEVTFNDGLLQASFQPEKQPAPGPTGADGGAATGLAAAASAGAPAAAGDAADPEPLEGPPAQRSAAEQQVETRVPESAAVGAPRIQDLMRRMIDQRASDLHLTSGLAPALRVDGQIEILSQLPALPAEQLEALLMEITPERNREEFQRRHDTDFAYVFGAEARFRINLFCDRFGIGAVMRLIPSRILTCEQLGVPAAVRQLTALSKGFVVVAGPTGCGKSTTLAALIDLINETRHDHIITIEDPVEFVHQHKSCLIHQREVYAHTDSFRDALRAALREDPDIVLVGEMRDLETISIAIETAETGHLVFGTLHTNTAASTVDRIIDQFPADRQAQIRTMLSESLRGVVCQTLLRSKGGGRVAAFEVLICNRAVRNLIREGKTFQIPSVMQTQKSTGNQLLNDALLELIKSDVVTPEAAYRTSVDKESFAGQLRRANIKVEGVREQDWQFD
ncbi:MAG TPA: type IV pilus twitching motility protein PilT [Acidobacteriota bacterium]